jgi:hypothetical protein
MSDTSENASVTSPQTIGSAGQVLTANGNGTTSWTTPSGGGSGANTSLSNLTSPTSINQDLIPSTNGSISLGTNIKTYNNACISGGISNGGLIPTIDLSNYFLKDSSNSISLDWSNRQLKIGSSTTLDWSSSQAKDGSNIPSISWSVRELNNSDGAISVAWNSYSLQMAGAETLNWGDKTLLDSSGNLSINWQNRSLVDTSQALAIDYNVRTLYDTAQNPSVDFSSTDRLAVSKVLNIISLSSDPASGNAGDIYFNSTLNKLKFYNGTAWETVTSA